MANQPQSPPDGWRMITGTWGTQVTALGSGGIGAGGINITGICTMASDWISLDSASSDIGYTATANVLLQIATNPANIAFVQYQANKTTIVATTKVVDSTITYYTTGKQSMSVNFLSNTSAPFGRWEITNTGFGAIIFSVALEKIRSALLLINPTVTAAASAWTTVTWTVQNGYAAGIQSGSGGNIALRKAGLYLFCFNLTVKTTSLVASGNYIQSRILQVNSATSTSTVVSPPFMQAFSNNNDTTPTVSWSYVLNVPSISAALASSAFVPYYQTQIFCPLALTAVAASSSLSVVSLS